MAVFEWARFIIGAILLLCGLGIFVVEMIGIFKFKYVLNRMHAAAMGDTLGIGFALLGLVIMNGWNFTSAKLLFVIVFLWFASPTASHLIARLEVTTNEDKVVKYRKVALHDLEKELAEKNQESDPEKEAENAGI
ncbi:MAG: monovalent cation/H(+) antiporter subunit G [Eubacteriales bacterium]|nr:monovalent cation/H(+) antiporter subunit G [Eubacteriales bacterium]